MKIEPLEWHVFNLDFNFCENYFSCNTLLGFGKQLRRNVKWRAVAVCPTGRKVAQDSKGLWLIYLPDPSNKKERQFLIIWCPHRSRKGQNVGHFVLWLAPWPVWPDLARICNLGDILQSWATNLSVYLVFGKTSSSLWSIFYAIGQIFFVPKGPNWTNHLPKRYICLDANLRPCNHYKVERLCLRLKLTTSNSLDNSIITPAFEMLQEIFVLAFLLVRFCAINLAPNDHNNWPRFSPR